MYVDRVAFVPISGGNKAKIEFWCQTTEGEYDKLNVSIVNETVGLVDRIDVIFKDLLGRKQPNAPPHPDPALNMPWNTPDKNGIYPHAKEYGETTWRLYTPNDEDYAILTKAVKDYVDVFDGKERR